jgi:hypothetical protein
VPRTSEGRKVRFCGKTTQPQKGEFYLKPSGRKGIFLVLQAQNDFARNYFSIIEIIS